MLRLKARGLHFRRREKGAAWEFEPDDKSLFVPKHRVLHPAVNEK